MQAKFPQNHVMPQQFYIKVTEGENGKPKSECVSMRLAEEALVLDVYHTVIDHLCAENGFLYMTIDDDSCPKYLHTDGYYAYRAHNYFIDEGLIYHCVASLDMDKAKGFQLVLDFYYDKHPIAGKTRRINLYDFLCNIPDDKEKPIDELLDHVSYSFADGIMHVAAEAVMWGSWGYDAQRSTAFPELMQYHTLFLERVIIPEYVLAPLKKKYQEVSKAAVTGSSGIGRDATIDVEFLADGELKTGTVSLYIYTQLLHKAAVGSYGKEIGEALFKGKTQPMASWQVLYG